MRKFVIAAAAFAVALAGGAALAQQRTLAIGTGGTGGVYYPLGGGLANLISKSFPNVQATAQVTGGSVDNLKLIGSGQSELAFVMADAALDAQKGQIGTEAERILVGIRDRLQQAIADPTKALTQTVLR